MEEQTAGFRTRVTVDLTLIDTLLDTGNEAMAAAALEEQRQALRAYIAGIERAVAAASAGDPSPQVIDLTADVGTRVSSSDGVGRISAATGLLRSMAMLAGRLLRSAAALALAVALVAFRVPSRRLGQRRD